MICKLWEEHINDTPIRTKESSCSVIAMIDRVVFALLLEILQNLCSAAGSFIKQLLEQYFQAF